MVYALSIVVALLAAAITLISFINTEAKEEKRIHDNYNALEKPYSYREHRFAKQTKTLKTVDIQNLIETAMVRTCRDVMYKARDRHCNGWSEEKNTWKFLGDIGTTGELTDVLSQPTSDVFSCATFYDGSYGRHIFKNSLKGIKLDGFKYDLSNVTNRAINPCSYDDLVTF